FAFAMAELLFGYLNASTAFMGSIVVGNGINFPIIQLARYEEERRGGKNPRESASVALSATIRPTAVAALGAAVAYASLTVTRFRGFSQFGTIGGFGMVAAWVATVAVLPALWAAFDKRERTARRFAPPVTAFSELVARIATQAPRSCLIVFGLLTVVSVLPLSRYLHDPFEYDFRNLRNRRSLESGAALLAERVDPIFGKTLTPAVIIADRRSHTNEIRNKVLERDRSLPGPQLIGQVTTLDDFLPGDAATQRAKLEVLRELDEIIDSPAAQLADDDVRADLQKLRPPDKLAIVTDGDLPLEVKRPFVENDGTIGRVVLVYHDAHVSVWDGRNLVRIADIIGEIPLDDGTIVRSSGHAVIFAAMIRSIVHDAPLATGASILAVSLLVIALARSRAYAALLVADNQALRSFGEMAILGEVACLSAAIVGMPAFLVWRERRARLERPA
ncbi:MAG: MMPL family transporter, partial [Myxococcales bacterium]|nr:MMPL family transporter [Myxococcales bacterium]